MLTTMFFFVSIVLKGASESEPVKAESPVPIAQAEKQNEATYKGKTVSQWVKILESSDVRTERHSAARALGNFGSAGVPALIAALNDQDNYVRINAAVTLGNIGPAAKAAIPALKDALKDKVRFADPYPA